MNKESTRYKSNQQEKRIAKAMGGRQVIGSGSTPFLKGDVIAGKLFIEAKTRVNPSKSIRVNKEWLEKAREQAYSSRKEDYAVAISFGDGRDYYIIEDRLMEELYRGKEALRAILEEIGGTEHDPLGLESADEYKLKELIKEALEQ